jgi:hypothetical protein
MVVEQDSAVFIAGYSGLVTAVWSDPAKERLLETDPARLVAEYGIVLPDGVDVTVLREVPDAEPDLDAQVRAWQEAERLGQLVLYVPPADLAGATELDEHELDGVVGGLDAACSCCCPCCCS